MKQRSDITILFVDDESDILSSIRRFLRRETFNKHFADSGKNALELMTKESVDVVVTDLRMPGMNGLELIKTIKKHHPDTIRIMLSGSQDIDQIIDSINTGEVFRFIPKPVDPSSFKAILNDAIDYYLIKKEREELFHELSVKNQELIDANEALQLVTRELQRSEQQYRSMNDAAHDAVFLLDKEQRIIYRNSAAEIMFGFKRDEYRKQHFLDLVMNPESLDINLEQFCSLPSESGNINGQNVIHQVEGKRKNGSSLPLEISKGCVHIDTLPHTVIIARDISARIEAERSRQRYDTLQKTLESQIEKKLLQNPAPVTIEGAMVSRLMLSSGHLDGDFTDFVIYDKQHVDILIGDVMGHGIQSALVGAGVKNLFLKSLAQAKSRGGQLPDIEATLTTVHAQCIHELIELGTYTTLLFLRLDLANKEFSIIDCGHTPTIHFHSKTGTCTLLKGTNLPIGMIEKQHYETVSFPVEENDLLVLYSDGITESRSPGSDILFGTERLAALIESHCLLSPKKLIEKIHEAIAAFSGDDKFDDDVTCIVIRIGDTRKKKM
ncbi:SpoIIE family protein phosphatase [Prosthecochloris sp. SCSIO W1101]|uniref:SpoIIE family protein phosphatase n=1 Tax=Prosthecochloris sp. SCSIO W1101 TaxID=2992242 RepID=UPI00223E3FD3|nr:SpoIIE family protein phosphatase [Prosthecochloris sp. SCSIO W1101]UZJ41318.1 SpoIIE family protein phosphatase [Prosthecochloris sp. SCSIO W1101]